MDIVPLQGAQNMVLYKMALKEIHSKIPYEGHRKASMEGIYIAPLSKALYNVCLSFTHSHTKCHERYQPARQEQLGVRRLAQGHFDMLRVGSNRQPSVCQTTPLAKRVGGPLWRVLHGIIGVNRFISVFFYFFLMNQQYLTIVLSVKREKQFFIV